MAKYKENMYLYKMIREYEHIENTLTPVRDSSKNKYGQYFTPKIIAEFMTDLANIDADTEILEPSCGEGIFLDVLKAKGFNRLTAYEIDTELGHNFDFIIYESFVSANINQKFGLIIGNPPYIRWRNLEDILKEELATNRLWNKYFNSLCDYLYIFIIKSIELLKENGQLIFICPEYWMNTTHSISLRNYMVEHGYFEKIYHLNETPIFINATVSIVIFKYIKSKNKKDFIDVTKYYKNKIITSEVLEQLKDTVSNTNEIDRFQVEQFEKNKRWLLTDKSEIDKINNFENSCTSIIKATQDLFGTQVTTRYTIIGDVCDIGNGMVSGLDKAFQLNGQTLTNIEESNTIQVVKAKDLEPFLFKKTTKYIFANEVECENDFEQYFPNFKKKLFPQKKKLERRYQYNRKIPYWQWAFLRNYNLFSSNVPRIFVPCKERISNKNYFRFALVESGIYPTQDVTAIFPKQDTEESIYYILAFLNNHRAFNWLKNKGIVKGNIVEFSEKPISSIPFKRIDWDNTYEVNLHHQITELTKTYIGQKEDIILDEINDLIDKILV